MVACGQSSLVSLVMMRHCYCQKPIVPLFLVLPCERLWPLGADLLRQPRPGRIHTMAMVWDVAPQARTATAARSEEQLQVLWADLAEERDGTRVERTPPTCWLRRSRPPAGLAGSPC